MPEPACTHMFVAADGMLAEYLCHVELLDLTEARAVALHAIHRDHPRWDCLVRTATERYTRDSQPGSGEIAPTAAQSGRVGNPP